jgi:hypothetical protein
MPLRMNGRSDGWIADSSIDPAAGADLVTMRDRKAR